MDGERVDLGDVRGHKGLTGVGISSIVEMGYDNTTSKRNFRIIFTDNTTFDYSLTDNSIFNRLNSMTVGNPSSDMIDVPTMYLLKNTLSSYPKNTDVYRKELTYSKDETNELISTAISQLELVIVVESLDDVDEPLENRLYMVTDDLESNNDLNTEFDLYIYIGNEWKQLDGLEFSIADYLTASQVNSLLANKQDKSNISNNITSDSSSTTKYPSVNAIKSYIDTKVPNGLEDYYTKTEIDSMIGDLQDFIHS